MADKITEDIPFFQKILNKQSIKALVVIGILICVGITVWVMSKTLLTFNGDNRSRAETHAAPITNFYGLPISSLQLFGQRSITEIARGQVTGNRAYHTAGLAVDKSTRPNKVYIVDTGNNRILGFKGVGNCRNSNTSCTVNSDCASGSECVADGTKNADIALGQPDLSSSACNGDSNLGDTLPPSESTLCLLGVPNFSNNVAEAWIKMNIDTDSEGNLYAVDWVNNRILKYNQPLSDDHNGGRGDAIADFVWGQETFRTNTPNQGVDYFSSGTVTNKSIWIGSNAPSQGATGRGVSVDNTGHVWVADTGNHRVLRFPGNSKIADLVIGQSNFSETSLHCEENAPLNSLCSPILAKVDPATNELYVLDQYPDPFKARILVYHSNFANGATAYRKIVLSETTGNPFQVTSFMFNTFAQGEYATGTLWLNEHQNNRTVLIDNNNSILKVVNAKSVNENGGDHQYDGGCGSIYDNYKLWTPGGSFGLDIDNNFYFANDVFHNVVRYSLPYNLQNIGGHQCLPDPNGFILGLGPNSYSDNSLREGGGMVLFGNQLIINDAGVLKVWSDYKLKGIGDSPDLVVSNPDIPGFFLSAQAIDDQNRLWLTVRDVPSEIQMWQLPLRADSRPIATHIQLYWQDTNTPVDFSGGLAIVFDTHRRALYISDNNNNRILRVTNYNPVDNKLYVDMVLGQPTKDTTSCSGPNATTICLPGNMKFDNNGNLFVAENAYECHGNDRISIFTRESLDGAQGMFPNVAASRALVGTLTSKGPCAYGIINAPGSPFGMTFTPDNKLIVGNDGYYGDIKLRQVRQLWVYNNPLVSDTPDSYIPLPIGTAAEMIVDSDYNFYVQDHTWNRVWGINLLRDPQWMININTIIPSPTNDPIRRSRPTGIVKDNLPLKNDAITIEPQTKDPVDKPAAN